MKRPTYHCYNPGPEPLASQPVLVQLWLGWGYTWAVAGPLLCVSLWISWWRA